MPENTKVFDPKPINAATSARPQHLLLLQDLYD